MEPERGWDFQTWRGWNFDEIRSLPIGRTFWEYTFADFFLFAHERLQLKLQACAATVSELRRHPQDVLDRWWSRIATLGIVPFALNLPKTRD